MSVVCFTCSSITSAVFPMTNTCHWGILCSLLLPDQNIEHVFFPNPDLHLCTKCTETLHHISEFKNVAVNSARTMLERWNCEMNPHGNTQCSVKTEIENDIIKQEVMDEDTVCDKMNNSADLLEVLKSEELEGDVKTECYDSDDNHSEPCAVTTPPECCQASLPPVPEATATLETPSEIYTQVKTEQETLNSTEDIESQNEHADWYRWLSETAQSCNDGDGTVDNLDGMTESEANRDNATEPDVTRRSRKALASAGKARKKTRMRKQPSEPPKKNKKNCNTKTINTKELEAYRSEWLASEQFRKARYKCASCLLVFGARGWETEHRAKYHAKRPCLQECIVCKQTMMSVRLAKHIASHFELLECKKCGHLTHDADSLKQHSCVDR